MPPQHSDRHSFHNSYPIKVTLGQCYCLVCTVTDLSSPCPSVFKSSITAWELNSSCGCVADSSGIMAEMWEACKQKRGCVKTFNRCPDFQKVMSRTFPVQKADFQDQNLLPSVINSMIITMCKLILRVVAIKEVGAMDSKMDVGCHSVAHGRAVHLVIAIMPISFLCLWQQCSEITIYRVLNG